MSPPAIALCYNSAGSFNDKSLREALGLSGMTLSRCRLSVGLVSSEKCSVAKTTLSY